MKVKHLGIGLVAAAMFAVPSISRAIAQAHHTGHSNAGSHHVEGSAVYCIDDETVFSDNGGFARWTTNHGGHPIFTFGSTSSVDDESAVGLRLESAGLPARSFQLDWNLTNADFPEFIAIVTNAGGGASYVLDFISAFSNNGRFQSVTNLNNGFTRFVYSASGDGVPSGAIWNNIYFVDFPESSNGTTDSIGNVFVNGAAVIPNTANTIQQDCTIQ